MSSSEQEPEGSFPNQDRVNKYLHHNALPLEFVRLVVEHMSSDSASEVAEKLRRDDVDAHVDHALGELHIHVKQADGKFARELVITDPDWVQPVAVATRNAAVHTNALISPPPQPPRPPSLLLDPLAFARYLVSPRDRDSLDLVRLDLRDDLVEMLEGGYSARFALAVIWWRSATNAAPFFWRGVRRLLPFKKVGWEEERESAR